MVLNTLLKLLAKAIQDIDQVDELNKIGVYYNILVELDKDSKVKLRQAYLDNKIQKKIMDLTRIKVYNTNTII